MYVLLLLLATALVSAAQDIDPAVLCQVFGCPGDSNFSKPTPSTVYRIKPEEVTVIPTIKPSTFTDKNGEECTCVPYYLCNNELVAVDANNRSVTGWGDLDIRFGESDTQCQESVERCCTKPKSPDEVPTPVPDATRLLGCGYRNPKGLDFTLVGGSGSEALFGEFPWVVALLDALNNSYAGVGVLIHPQVVMTGAHIASKYSAGKMLIRAGEWDTQTSKERLPHQQRLVEEIIVHPEFRKKSLWNDIALLKLDSPVQLADHINVICLPSQDENFGATKNCVANGWGKNTFGLQGRYAVFLKKVEQDMVPNKRCEILLKRTRLGNNFKLHNSFVCSGGEEGKDTCQGDGGAPLACPIGNNRYKLTGLVAWGIGCGQKDVPGVSASVAKFRDWVDNAMTAWGFDTSVYNI